VNHIENYCYDYIAGLLKGGTDENSQTTLYTYADSFDRLTEINYPDGGETLVSYNDTPPSPVVVINKEMSSGHFLTTEDVMDGVGLVTDSELTSDPSGTDNTTTAYDGLGRVYTVSNPYRSTSDPTYGLTTYTYDALGRTTLVTHPDSSQIATTYQGAATEVNDEGNGSNSIKRISQTDGLGRMTSLCEITNATQMGGSNTPAPCGLNISGTGFLTSYEYDTLGNLIQATQGGLNLRTFNYDSLSELTSATNPESGQTTYTYDANGNMLTKDDARSITDTYSYDALNRLLSKTYSDSTPSATYVYDACPTGGCPSGVSPQLTVGRLVEASNTNAKSWNSYDAMGRIVKQWQCVPFDCGTGELSLPYTYDLMGNMTSAGNGASVTISYAYNAAAEITSVTSSLSNPTHPATLFSNAVYNAPALLTSALLGNGVSESRSYNSRMRLTSLTAGSLYSLSMSSYAPDGDILSVNDSVNGNWTYTYDDFNRLATANAIGQAYTYKYDRYGNRWQQNGPQSMQLTFSGNNNRMDGYSYDASGNLLGDGTHTYAYDAESRIKSVDNGATTYLYDADGRRVEKDVSGAITEYLYDLAGNAVTELSSGGSWERGEVYAGGRHLSTYVDNTTFFEHSDWLGSERLRSDLSGAACETITSLPFGDGMATTGSCSDISTRHFTGKFHDAETNLDDFGARYYSSQFGRFVSADWSAVPVAVPYADLTNPQTLNLYAIVHDNPSTFADLDGHTCGSIGDSDRNGCSTPTNTKTAKPGDGSTGDGTGKSPAQNAQQQNNNQNQHNETQEQKDEQQYHQALEQRKQQFVNQQAGPAVGSQQYVQQLSTQVYGESIEGIKMDLIITAPETTTAAVVASAPAAAAAGGAIEAGAQTTRAAATDYVLSHPSEAANFAQGLVRGPAGAPPTPAGVLGAVVNIAVKRLIP
jgi:RHS repeat-associated protein